MSMTIEELEQAKNELRSEMEKIIDAFISKTKIKDITVIGKTVLHETPSGKKYRVNLNVDVVVKI